MDSPIFITLELDEANSCVVYLHGATITSWISNGQERLFLSEKAVLDNKKAIRGGIPVVFPNFGPWDGGRPQHGFARTKRWQAKSTPQRDETNKSVRLVLELDEDAETLQLWNYKFRLSYEIVLTVNSLKTTLNVLNKDSNPFDFTCLLHTYFKVPNIDDVCIHGLHGLHYADKVSSEASVLENNEEIRLNSEVDRVYENSPSEHVLNISGKKAIQIVKNNFNDTVVWNPWIEKAAKMADFGDDEYKIMVCIEPGSVSKRIVLKPNETFSAYQELKLLE